MRRILSVILCLCVVLTLFSGITVSAQSDKETLYERVRAAALEFNPNVDFSDLNLGENKREALSAAIQRLTNDPEFFYVSNGFSYLPNRITLNFNYNKAKAAAMKNEFDAVAREIVITV